MPATVIYLSPHLDDAVLSCGGRILADVRAGRRAIVATVFSHGDDTTAAQAVYRIRQAEDLAAVTHLGAEAVWLGLPDAPYRRPGYYRTYRQIVLEHHFADAGYATVVAAQLRELAEQHRPDGWLAPLGVGGHIDHHLVYAAVGQANLPNVRNYEDRPYCFVRHAVLLRRAELADNVVFRSAKGRSFAERKTTLQPFLQEHLADFDHWHWLDSYLPRGPERDACRRILSERLAVLSLSPAQSGATELVASDEPSLAIIAAAAQCYASQFPTLFADRDDFLRRACRRYAAKCGAELPYAERYWQESIT